MNVCCYVTHIQHVYKKKKKMHRELLFCSDKSQKLFLFFSFPPVGPVSVHLSSPLSLEEIRQRNPLVLPGGRYRPPDCEPRHHTAIVVPYRNRQTHLRALLYHLHPFLQRQQIHYSIYIVQQVRMCMSVMLVQYMYNMLHLCQYSQHYRSIV